MGAQPGRRRDVAVEAWHKAHKDATVAASSGAEIALLDLLGYIGVTLAMMYDRMEKS